MSGFVILLEIDEQMGRSDRDSRRNNEAEMRRNSFQAVCSMRTIQQSSHHSTQLLGLAPFEQHRGAAQEDEDAEKFAEALGVHVDGDFAPEEAPEHASEGQSGHQGQDDVAQGAVGGRLDEVWQDEREHRSPHQALLSEFGDLEVHPAHRDEAAADSHCKPIQEAQRTRWWKRGREKGMR